MKKQNSTKKQENVSKKGHKKSYTYAEAHNRAFWAFNKATRVMIWAGILNVVGLMVGILQEAFGGVMNNFVFPLDTYLHNTIVNSGYQYSLCFGTNALIFRLLESYAFNKFVGEAMSEIVFVIIIVIIAILFSGIIVYLSVLASQGKKWALFTQSIFYIVDTGAIIGNYIIGEHISILWIQVALHIVILFFVVISIYQYYHLFAIERIYKKTITNNGGTNNVEVETKEENQNGN